MQEIAQSENIEDFSNYEFISSPLIRTKHTLQIIMEILNQTEKKIILDPLLASRKKGILEGIKKEDIKKDFSKEYENQQKDKWTYIPPNGESRQMLYYRIKEFVEKYKNKDNLIIVTHKGCAYLMKEILLGKSEDIIKNDFSKRDKLQNYFYIWNKKENIIDLV